MKVFIKSLSIFLVIVVVAICVASCGPSMQEISGNYSESYSYGGDYYNVFLLLDDDGTYMKTALKNGNIYSQSNGSFTIRGNEVILHDNVGDSDIVFEYSDGKLINGSHVLTKY